MIKINKSTILIAPLDWGLGHATRCIPIIRTLKNAGYDIIVAVNEKQKILLSKELSNVKFLELAGYNINYAKNPFLFALKIFIQVPKIIASIKKENRWLSKIIEKENIDLVISDNRFGLYTNKVPCVFITHQLTIKTPFTWLQNILQKINYKYINRFTQCWIPDVAGENNIAGILSHPNIYPKVVAHYIGVLSRFNKPVIIEKKYDICVLLSGPEPQRTLLENSLLNQLKKIENTNILFVRGLPQTKDVVQAGTIQIENHLQQNELQTAICNSEIIIARSGYTTVMELLSLQKKSILIATPGQTEQEYLASHLHQQKKCLSYKQRNIDIVCAINTAKTFNFDLSNTLEFEAEKFLALTVNLMK